MTCNLTNTRENHTYSLNETFNCERKMQNVANLIKHLFVYNFASCLYGCAAAVHRVWETVKNVVPRNSSSKPDQLGSERKGDEQSLNA